MYLEVETLVLYCNLSIKMPLSFILKYSMPCYFDLYKKDNVSYVVSLECDMFPLLWVEKQLYQCNLTYIKE